MEKYYFHAVQGNFGDDLNGWLWDELLPGVWHSNPELYFSGIGTILGPTMPKQQYWIICGSGTGYGAPAIDMLSKDVFVACVRGPLTAQVTGLSERAAVTDGAILLSTLDRFRPAPEQEREGIIFVPHVSAFAAGHWKEAAKLAGVNFVDPRQNSEKVVDCIRKSHLVLADSMHAAIVADTMRVPWVAVSTSPEINEFKWLDWTLSVGVPYEPFALPPSSLAEAVRSRGVASSRPRVASLDQIERALETYAKLRLSGQRENRFKQMLRPTKNKILKGWPVRAAKIAGGAARYDSRYLDPAASALQRAASTKGILSEGAVWRERLAEFESRLDEVRDYAARFEVLRA
jgi:succinoglycan biosynthesis protein ExoV